MTIITGDLITKQEIIDRFNLRVRDWVTANTNWLSTTAVWNTNVGTVTANSTTGGSTQTGTAGGSYNRTTFSTAAPAAPQESDFNLVIGARTNAGTVVQTLKNFMILYANNHKINLLNTGNVAPTSYTGVARLNGTPAATVTNIGTDVDNAAIANNLATGQVITATNINAFIESCRTIWSNRCNPTNPLEEFRYNYCHSSCHTNYTCYNSRGRR